MLIRVESDWLLGYVKDDPVRPHLPAAWRIRDGREVYALMGDNGPRAMICVAYTQGVAITEDDLNRVENPDTAMFYTVWSYAKGAGREIVFAVTDHIRATHPAISKFVTLSPLTDMAERFHISNGARFVRRGETCQNFEYTIS